jgi:hypothetical protein
MVGGVLAGEFCVTNGVNRGVDRDCFNCDGVGGAGALYTVRGVVGAR